VVTHILDPWATAADVDVSKVLCGFFVLRVSRERFFVLPLVPE
jgi:hypothetical protein